MKNLLSIESLTRENIEAILELAAKMKTMRGCLDAHPLKHKCWALIFTKSSTRTRVSFEVGIRELGGDVLFLNANDIQLGRGEPIKDTARVLGRMIHGAVIRTYAQQDVVDFAHFSGLPTINALTDEEREKFTHLNAAYVQKFGFPFIIAVRDHSKAEIMAAFEQRLGNSRETEIETAGRQVERIAELRLRALLTD